MNIINTNLKFKGLNYTNKPSYIILHHAVFNGTVEQIHKMHMSRGYNGIGYQYYVRKDGKVYKGRPENAVGAHCPNYNGKSIGICAEGDYTKDNMSDVQKKAIIELCRDIKKRYRIVEIAGHKKYKATACPGNKYPLSEIIRESNEINIVEVINNMDIKALQNMCNVLGIRDNSGKALDVDGKEGTKTKEAKVKLKEILVYVLK